ncbi:MAG: acetylserotonin O-methyltransferase [Actinomycetota bacterium]|nr:acetylserotonin O-methyltransferase [Actinomycetota bacterium]
MDPRSTLHRLVNGFQVSQALHVAAVLGLSDQLADGPRSVADLAVAASTDEQALHRLLRALATAGVYAVGEDGQFANTEVSEGLRRDAPGSLAGWAAFVGRPYQWQAWASLLDSIRTGDNAFATVHGESVWAYRSTHPDEQEIFDDAMTSLSAVLAHAAADAYDFSRFGTVVDVGGGHGVLLAAILRRYPTVRGILFDQPAVVAAAGLLDDADLTGRVERVGGSFFESVPTADAYVLKAVIHDWPEDEAVAILRRCREAMAPDGAVLLVEQLLGSGPDPYRAAFSDLNMLVGPGGQERTLEEYGAVFSAAGLRLTRAVPTGTAAYVIEALR